MLKDFLHVWQAIKIVISLSITKSFEKNKEILLLKDSEIAYLEKCLKIFNIFVKPKKEEINVSIIFINIILSFI